MARRADAVRNTRLLLAAARDLFDEHGPDVALDEIARRAGVGNATLYRHFPTRGDLLAAVYAEEVSGLCAHGAALLTEPAADEALFTWLDAFVVHTATKRDLAMAATAGAAPDGGADRRGELFGGWHAAMRAAAGPLLERAQRAGGVRPGLSVDDLLALAGAAAVAGAGPDRARALLRLMRDGIATGAGPADRADQPPR
ncbi:TetR/AcrR family transcriptional regulator [Spirillospora sp. NBC_00431]